MSEYVKKAANIFNRNSTLIHHVTCPKETNRSQNMVELLPYVFVERSLDVVI